MLPLHLYYLAEKGTVWFNPSYGLLGFWEYQKKLAKKLNLPIQKLWTQRDLKRAKEIYAISIVAKIQTKSTNTLWWIHKPNNDPPDGVIGTIIKNPNTGYEEMHVREVEVVEHLGGEIIDTIRTKLSKKRYEPSTALVCYLSAGDIFEPEKIAKTLIQEQTSLDHLFLVFPGVKLSDIPTNASRDELIRALLKINLVQIKPIFTQLQIDLIDDCKEWREGKEPNFFIFEGKGRGRSRPITLKNPPALF